MGKRFTKEQWEEVKTLFISWCVVRGEFELNHFWKAHKAKKWPFGYEGFRLKAKAWQEEIEEAIYRSGIKGAEEEYQRKKDAARAEEMTIIKTAAQTVRDRAPQIEIINGVVSDCIQDGIVGYQNSTKVFAAASEITRVQFEKILERVRNGEDLTMEEVGAMKLLMDTLKTGHSLFKGTAIIPKERVKEIQALEEVAKIEYIKEAEKAKSNAKETDESKAQKDIYERLRQYANDKHGVEV